MTSWCPIGFSWTPLPEVERSNSNVAEVLVSLHMSRARWWKMARDSHLPSGERFAVQLQPDSQTSVGCHINNQRFSNLIYNEHIRGKFVLVD